MDAVAREPLSVAFGSLALSASGRHPLQLPPPPCRPSASCWPTLLRMSGRWRAPGSCAPRAGPAVLPSMPATACVHRWPMNTGGCW